MRKIKARRYPNNPILGPDRNNPWEAQAVFNGCPVADEKGFHLLYRALSFKQNHMGERMELSTIGHVFSQNGICFSAERNQLISPMEEWEKFGCEDPRVTKIDDKYYITYTALSDYPHTSDGIKVAVAITKDFKSIEERHLVTHFNSKAMVIFPEKVNGKIIAMLTMNTDKPPVRILLVEFDNPEQLWDKNYWDKILSEPDKHTLHFQRSLDDHIEVGAPPVKTVSGWLALYSYIRDYRTGNPVFGIEAALLDLQNPLKITGRTITPLIQPEELYEIYGMIPNVSFPSGLTLRDDELRLYYGAADNVCALATFSLKEILEFIKLKDYEECEDCQSKPVFLERFEGNPILKPKHDNSWRSKYVLNPTAVYDDGFFHILYRAQNEKGTSFIGHAISEDGLHLIEESQIPIYVPRIVEEIREESGNSGCEDARITKMGDNFYMCYTAYNGYGPTRVAFTSISVENFRAKNWDKWSMPIIISPDGIDDKNACLVEEKINGKYVFFHRINHEILIDYVSDLSFSGGYKLAGKVILGRNKNSWDSEKVGIAGPPIKIGDEWLLIYHALSSYDGQYRLGAALLDLERGILISRLSYPILSPKADYENKGLRPGTVFSCGAVPKDDILYVYYGGADEFVCVATVELSCLIDALRRKRAVQ